MSITLFVPSCGYTTWLCFCLQLGSDTFLASCYRQTTSLGVRFCLRHNMGAGIVLHVPILFPFGWSSEVVSEHTLKLFSVRSFCTNGGCHPLTLEFEQEYHVYICDSSTEGEATWWTKSSLWVEYYDVSSSWSNDITHCFSSFSSIHNLGTRFLLKREGCDIPCHENPKSLPLTHN
jgi:hypothetical protein